MLTGKTGVSRLAGQKARPHPACAAPGIYEDGRRCLLPSRLGPAGPAASRFHKIATSLQPPLPTLVSDAQAIPPRPRRKAT
jgi:hypothetical protein